MTTDADHLVNLRLRQRPENRLLASVPPDDFDRIARHLVKVALSKGQVLYKEDETIRDVFFLNSGLCSLTKTMQNGATSEIAAIGNEGVIGASVYFGEKHSMIRAMVPVAGIEAFKMTVDAFVEEMERRSHFYSTVVRYTQAFTSQIIQTGVCNSIHSAEQRCCRWLLMTHDRVDSDDFPLTQEFLAQMLGVARPTVNIAGATLQKAGFIEYTRGRITVLDRAGLESASCECYRRIRQELEYSVNGLDRPGMRKRRK